MCYDTVPTAVNNEEGDRLGNEWIEISHVEDLGVLVDE